MRNEKVESRKNRWRTPTALCVSAGWLLLVIWWTFLHPSDSWKVPDLALNNWGDLAGGAFAPLAFLWLVVGYFQQGEELRGNVKALHLQEEALRLQVQELKESVEQQTAAAKAAGRQADMLERSQEIALRSQVLAHQPRFINFHTAGNFTVTHAGPDGVPQSNRHLKLQFVNWGCACHELTLSVTQPKQVGLGAFPLFLGHFAKESAHTIELTLTPWPMHFIDIEFGYTDELLVDQKQTIRLDARDWNNPEKQLAATLEHMTFNLPVSLDEFVTKP